jgi:acyl-CoA thioesterase-2
VPASTAELVELLSLETLDTDLYRGTQPETTRQRVFGGQVAAQALVAGTLTVDPAYRPHSLHSYFLRPGDTQVPIIYDVERLRDGRSFATRRVVARQHGRAIYFQTANFQREEKGLEHQNVMPEVPGPEAGLRMVDLMKQSGNPDADALAKEWGALEARYVGHSQHGLDDDPRRPARAQMWMRVQPDLGDDPLVHLAAFTYASDMSLLGVSLAAQEERPDVQMASLDHTIWFHRPFRVDEWWLYEQYSPSAQGGRGLALGEVYTRDGTLVATVAQEGLIRLPAE